VPDYVLSEHAARQVQDLIRDKGQVDHSPTKPTGTAKGISFVLAGNRDGTSEYWEGVTVSRNVAGDDWITYPAPVLIRSTDGLALASGRVYPCVPDGSRDGKPRYTAIPTDSTSLVRVVSGGATHSEGGKTFVEGKVQAWDHASMELVDAGDCWTLLLT
jgi:hypothetical protein